MLLLLLLLLLLVVVRVCVGFVVVRFVVGGVCNAVLAGVEVYKYAFVRDCCVGAI